MSVETHMVTFRPENRLERRGNFIQTSLKPHEATRNRPPRVPPTHLRLHYLCTAGYFLRITLLFIGSCIASEWKNGISLLLCLAPALIFCIAPSKRSQTRQYVRRKDGVMIGADARPH